MNRIWYTTGCAAVLVAALVASLAAAAPGGAGPAPAQDLLEPEVAFHMSARLVDSATISVSYDIADGYYMYRDKFRFRTEPELVGTGKPLFPGGEIKDDPNFGRVETYRGSVSIQLPLTTPAGESVTLIATSQGCADVGVCYLPVTTRVVLVAASASVPSPAAGGLKPLSSLLKN